MIELVDTHAHLTDQRLSSQVDALLARARSRGVCQVLAVAVTAEDSQHVIEVAEQRNGVFAAVGIQPNYVSQAQPHDWNIVEELAKNPKVAALGETGLDRYWNDSPFALQEAYFDMHLELAGQLQKSVVIHCRECEADIVSRLERRGAPTRGVLHSFTGTYEHAIAFMELGLSISFAGMITFPSKKLDPLRDAARRIPLDRLLVETDSPYLAPQSVRGKTNEPGNVRETAEFIANLRGISIEDLATAATANARRLFGFDDADQLGVPTEL
jgi:TatD DNase family protein